MSNTIDPGSKYVMCLRDYLDSLKLTPENRAVAEQYLDLGSEDALLARLTPQEMKYDGFLAQAARSGYAFELYRVNGQAILAKCLKLLWAVAGPGAAGLWDGYGTVGFPCSRDLEWRTEVIGRENTARMAAQTLASGVSGVTLLDWFTRLGQEEPTVFSEIFSSLQGDAAYVYSAIGISCVTDPKLCAAMNEHYIDISCELAGQLLGDGTPEDTALLRGYIRTGDPDAALPALASAPNAAVDLSTVQNAGYGEADILLRLAKAAMLAAERSGHARCVLRICTMLNPRKTLFDLLKSLGDDLFFREAHQLIRAMPGGAAAVWLLYHELTSRLTPIGKKLMENQTKHMEALFQAYQGDLTDPDNRAFLQQWKERTKGGRL